MRARVSSASPHSRMRNSGTRSSARRGSALCERRADSGSEHETSANGRMDDLVGHLGPYQVVESLSGAMARYQVIGVDLLERRDDLSNIRVGQWRHDVEAAHDRMHFLDAGSGLRLLDRVDDAAVTAGGEDDQALSLDDEIRSDLMVEIIDDKAAGIFRRRDLVRETSETIHDPGLLAARLQRLLKTAQRNLARGEGMIGDDRRA